jgi:aurora kinase
MKIEDFKLGRKMGSGKFGEVFIARHKKSGFICAIKRINKLNIDKKLLIQLIREIKIQSFLAHPNIVKLYTFFCDLNFIYLLLELCYSGQLYDFLKKKRKLSEPLTKNIVQQSLKALDYMHENEIIHRDLKP